MAAGPPPLRAPAAGGPADDGHLRSSSSSLSQANATLQQRRTAITDALASDQNNLRRRLASESRQRLMQLLINGLRILVTALATALFFRMLAQPSDQLLARLERTLEED